MAQCGVSVGMEAESVDGRLGRAFWARIAAVVGGSIPWGLSSDVSGIWLGSGVVDGSPMGDKMGWAALGCGGAELFEANWREAQA